MTNTCRRCLTVGSLAAVLAWTVGAIGADAPPDDAAQSSDDRMPAANQDRPSGGQDNQQSRDKDQKSRDQEPQTVSGQLQALKHQLRKEKSTGERTPIRDSEHHTATRTKNYIEIRERNIVMQQRDYSCGAATLATILRYYWGDDITEDQILYALDGLLTEKEIEDRLKNGLAMSDLRRAAVKIGYQSVVGKTSFEKLTKVKVPVIVGIEPEGHKHFVVYRGTDMSWVYIADPIRGNIRIPVWEFRKQWQENAVLVVHKPGSKVKEMSALSLTELDTDRDELIWHLIQTQNERMPKNRVVPAR